jgi:hypothetical protein
LGRFLIQKVRKRRIDFVLSKNKHWHSKAEMNVELS